VASARVELSLCTLQLILNINLLELWHYPVGFLYINKIGDAALVNKDIPFLQAHGDCDPVVPYKWGQLTSQILREILPKHEFKTYKVIHEFKTYKGMMHSSSDEEMKDVKQFIAKCLP